MTLVDWICIVLVLISLLLGLWRGLIYEVFALIGWIAAFFVAQIFVQRTLAGNDVLVFDLRQIRIA